MSDKPILFKPEMVRAILEGRKSQTRRIMPLSHPKFPKYNVIDPNVLADPNEVWFWDGKHEMVGASFRLKYAIGDRLWVRENHYLTDDGYEEYAVFAEDENEVAAHLKHIANSSMSDELRDHHTKLRPSIHLPRIFSRITLIVTDVRVQRIQDISEEDANSEGVILSGFHDLFCDGYPPAQDGELLCDCENRSDIDTFKMLWDSINAERDGGKFSWDSNPWIVAYTFKPIFQNIDDIKGAV